MGACPLSLLQTKGNWTLPVVSWTHHKSKLDKAHFHRVIWPPHLKQAMGSPCNTIKEVDTIA